MRGAAGRWCSPAAGCGAGAATARGCREQRQARARARGSPRGGGAAGGAGAGGGGPARGRSVSHLALLEEGGPLAQRELGLGLRVRPRGHHLDRPRGGAAHLGPVWSRRGLPGSAKGLQVGLRWPCRRQGGGSKMEEEGQLRSTPSLHFCCMCFDKMCMYARGAHLGPLRPVWSAPGGGFQVLQKVCRSESVRVRVTE